MTLGPRWFVLIAVAAALVATGGITPTASWIGAWLALGAVVVAISDALGLPSARDLTVERDAAPCMAGGGTYRVTLRVRSDWRHVLRVLVHDEPPHGMSHDWTDTALWLSPDEVGTCVYSVSPRRRGDYAFGDVWLRVGSRLGLMERILRYSPLGPVRVLPEVVAPGKLPLASFRARERGVGIRAQRWTGAGRQFESLRDYVQDDDYRALDWKATARRGKLTTRQYQMERSQVILLALDMGRTMLGDLDGVAKTDHAINAALALGQISATCDDHVGLVTFDSAVRHWMPPRKGRAQILQLVSALYAANAEKVEADYRSAADHILKECRSRSLIVFFTDVWEAGTSARLSGELRRIARRHLVLCVGMSDDYIRRQARAGPSGPGAAYRQAVALQMLQDRADAVRVLQARGISVLDSPAERLSADLVRRYLDVKRRALL